MAITTLASLDPLWFAGGAHLTVHGQDSYSLDQIINAMIDKANEIIGDMNTGTFDVLEVGTLTGTYYGGNDSYFSVDGTNPPTLLAFRIQDRLTGNLVTVTYDSGAGGWQFA